MADQTPKQGRVPLQEFLKDFRSPLSDSELRAKYALSARGFVSLIKALFAREKITQEDLVKRKETAVQRDLEKEHEFLAQLYICPNCGHPHPTPFSSCPACGADTSEAFGTADLTLDPLTSTGDHFYVDESELDSEPEEGLSAGNTEPADDTSASSPMKTVRSVISKLKKK